GEGLLVSAGPRLLPRCSVPGLGPATSACHLSRGGLQPNPREGKESSRKEGETEERKNPQQEESRRRRKGIKQEDDSGQPEGARPRARRGAEAQLQERRRRPHPGAAPREGQEGAGGEERQEGGAGLREHLHGRQGQGRQEVVGEAPPDPVPATGTGRRRHDDCHAFVPCLLAASADPCALIVYAWLKLSLAANLCCMSLLYSDQILNS
uniref:Uncharacterized protein n=1 Tax=Triticum urartu TaxID=4572 RepID=A0A8R7TAZ9_TRIUA